MILDPKTSSMLFFHLLTRIALWAVASTVLTLCLALILAALRHWS